MNGVSKLVRVLVCQMRLCIACEPRGHGELMAGARKVWECARCGKEDETRPWAMMPCDWAALTGLSPSLVIARGWLCDKPSK